MMNFYHFNKFTPLIDNNLVCVREFYEAHFFESFYDFNTIASSIQTPKISYSRLKKILSAHTLDKFTLDSHIIDTLPQFITNPLSVLVYIYLFRNCDKDMYIGSVEKIAGDLNQDLQKIKEALSELEEYILISIEGKRLLKISLNHNWSKNL